jgi:hypothetical protein
MAIGRIRGGALTLLAAAVLMCTFTGGAPGVASATNAGPAAAARSSEAVRLQNRMRRLWEDHIYWTRLFIVSFANSPPDVKATGARLLRNQDQIGNEFAHFYGDVAGDHVTSLLRRHILLAAQILKDAKSGHTKAFQQDVQSWYANANRIAEFLHSLNPSNWPTDAVRKMMHEHLALTLTEASDYLHGKFRQSVQDFRSVESEILHMANTLAFGIVRQFPGQF